MSKYKVGDVVKLRDDLEENKDYGYINAGMINQIKSEPFWIAEVRHDKYINSMGWVANDEMIEGLWEECKEKQDKLKLIDVLNMIAKGELKEGTKAKLSEDDVYEYKGINDWFMVQNKYLNAEVELIEPPCEHEWENYETHRIGEGLINKSRRCKKCGLEEVTEECIADVGKSIEPTKIEELGFNKLLTIEGNAISIINKLNEVIRKLNSVNGKNI